MRTIANRKACQEVHHYREPAAGFQRARHDEVKLYGSRCHSGHNCVYGSEI